MLGFLKKIISPKSKTNACIEYDEIEERYRKNQERQDHPYTGCTAYIKQFPDGSPERYYSAIQGWKYFVDYYTCFYAPQPYPYNIYELDFILDIATKINDKKVILQVIEDMRYVNFEKYDKQRLLEIFSMAETLQKFRDRFITQNPAKQTELVELLKPYIPAYAPASFSDGTWYFYVWRQFGIVKIEKKGRYNYVSLPY